MKRIIFVIITVLISVFYTSESFAHCEVPCGIYDDELRIELLREHIATIEKAINQINELSTSKELNYNQIIRWTQAKEDHANEVQHIVSQYFMTQRIKPVDPDEKEKHEKYLTQVTLLHQLLIFAMKAKQTTDLDYIDKMRSTVDSFEDAYFGPDHQHKH